MENRFDGKFCIPRFIGCITFKKCFAGVPSVGHEITIAASSFKRGEGKFITGLVLTAYIPAKTGMDFNIGAMSQFVGLYIENVV